MYNYYLVRFDEIVWIESKCKKWKRIKVKRYRKSLQIWTFFSQREREKKETKRGCLNLWPNLTKECED